MAYNESKVDRPGFSAASQARKLQRHHVRHGDSPVTVGLKLLGGAAAFTESEFERLVRSRLPAPTNEGSIFVYLSPSRPLSWFESGGLGITSTSTVSQPGLAVWLFTVTAHAGHWHGGRRPGETSSHCDLNFK